MSTSVAEPLPQVDSPLFTKLSHNIRVQIYRELFTSFRVHLQFAKPLKTGWCHRICWNDILIPHRGSKSSGERPTLETNILFTCKTAYQDGAVLLYFSNTLMFDQPIDYHNFTVSFPSQSPFIRSCEFVCPFRLDKPEIVPSLDTLTWALERYDRLPIKVSLRLEGFSKCRGERKSAHESVCDALNRFLCIEAKVGVIVLPSNLKEATRELVQKHNSKISFIFVERDSKRKC